MNSILQKIVSHKREEIAAAKSKRPLADVVAAASETPPALDFVAPLKRSGQVALIAEVKKASPSKGLIREDFDPVQIAKVYQHSGADCISVLTDEHFFQGHLDFLQQIRSAVGKPLLRKDFILDSYQVFEARAAGADAVLLIAECLAPAQLQELHAVILETGMTPLVELYDQNNVPHVLACDPILVGVNNRDLNTFEVDLQHSIRVHQQLPSSITFVSESGIFTANDVAKLKSAGVDAMLVGESLMRAPDIGQAVKSLMS